jgi:hypothetical protein
MTSDDAGVIVGRWREKRSQRVLPPISELAEIADRPLSDDEKIPISQSRFNELVSSINLQDICTADDVSMLFRPGFGGTALDKLFFTVATPPPNFGTEDLFHSFWDQNVRNILETIVLGGRSIRNGNWDTSTGTLRPDYGFSVRNICLFRGEEEHPGSADDPKKELAAKFTWVYDPAPYVLGRFDKDGLS